MNYELVRKQMVKFLKDEAQKIGVEKVVVGISGGLDSAIVAVLCKLAFNGNVHGVLMPSHYSSKSSIEDARELCNKFNIDYEIVPIEPMVKAYEESMDQDKLRIGNFSARMRMSVLYDISAREGAIVVGTSNRSEILLGYGTLFGDTACAINPIGNMYKSDEFEFAKFLGVPDSIIEKKPSADLWEGQSDEEELGYTYEKMDEILKLLYDQNISKSDLVEQGCDEELIEMIIYKKETNEFKGKLPTIAHIDFN